MMEFKDLVNELTELYGERMGQRDLSIDVATEDLILHIEWADMNDSCTELDNVSITILGNDMNRNIVNTVHVNATYMSIPILSAILSDYRIL